MARVELDRVSKVYEGKGQEAVREITLTVEPGELLVLVGPSGCGKSTLLRMIAGLEEITSGELRIDGRRVNDVPPKDRDVAMVFQNYALYPHMTVFDNMAFGLKLRKMPAAEIRERVGETARLMGLERYLGSKPRSLSGGERQRVALGRALVRRPRLFLFDEPLSNLDAKLRTHMRAEIARLHHTLATTMIYVTHDQVEAMTLGQRIAVLDAGRLQQCDDPMTVYRRPANRFVAGFIGSPAMNFLEATLGDSGATIEVGGRALPMPLARRAPAPGARRVILGVRPEHFALGPAGTAIPATVAVREPLGNEVLLHADTPAGEVIVRLQRDGGPAVGEAVSLVPDLAEAHLFDPESGAVLGA